MSREAMQQALEALELAKLNGKAGLYPGEVEEIAAAIAALHAALAESALDRMAENARELGLDYDTAEQAQPVACGYESCDCRGYCKHTTPPAPVVPQPLTIEHLRAALVAARVIPPEAVEDADNYDDGVMLGRIEALHRRIA